MALGEGAGQHCDATSVHATLLLSIYYMPHAVLGTQDESVNKTDKDIYLQGPYVLAVEWRCSYNKHNT